MYRTGMILLEEMKSTNARFKGALLQKSLRVDTKYSIKRPGGGGNDYVEGVELTTGRS